MRHYVPDNKYYEHYYTQQVGKGLPVFTGPRSQRGYGLGGILGGLFRSAMPLFKQGAKTLGREVLNTGVGLAQDALEGKNIKTAAKTRLRQAGRNLTQKAIRSFGLRQTGGHINRGIKRRASRRRITSGSGKRPKRSFDIFD